MVTEYTSEKSAHAHLELENVKKLTVREQSVPQKKSCLLSNLRNVTVIVVYFWHLEQCIHIAKRAYRTTTTYWHHSSTLTTTITMDDEEDEDAKMFDMASMFLLAESNFVATEVPDQA